MKTITIDESKWICWDHGEGFVRLENKLGFKCCLGFATEQLKPGVSIKDHFEPMDMCKKIPKLTILKGGMYLNTPFASKAMKINDDCSITYSERKKQLRALFKENGLRLVFKKSSK